MYADREEAGGGGSSRSIKDRLNGNFTVDSSTRKRLLTGKRQRQDDDKWEHDLYKDNEPQVSHHKVGVRDLRLKLQRKGLQSKGSDTGGVRDLREKLSGILPAQPANNGLLKLKPVPETGKTVRKSIAVPAPEPETKKVAKPVPKRRKADTSVDDFLQSLGLEKYLITFQAEEVDMTALVHMTDNDLKALGIPMGPRKKILLALESRV